MNNQIIVHICLLALILTVDVTIWALCILYFSTAIVLSTKCGNDDAFPVSIKCLGRYVNGFVMTVILPISNYHEDNSELPCRCVRKNVHATIKLETFSLKQYNR